MKMTLYKNSEGDLFWLPVNYESMGLEIENGIPEPVVNLSDEGIVELWHKVKDRLKANALSSNNVPDIVEVKNIFTFELLQVIKDI